MAGQIDDDYLAGGAQFFYFGLQRIVLAGGREDAGRQRGSRQQGDELAQIDDAESGRRPRTAERLADAIIAPAAGDVTGGTAGVGGKGDTRVVVVTGKFGEIETDFGDFTAQHFDDSAQLRKRRAYTLQARQTGFRGSQHVAVTIEFWQLDQRLADVGGKIRRQLAKHGHVLVLQRFEYLLLAVWQ